MDIALTTYGSTKIARVGMAVNGRRNGKGKAGGAVGLLLDVQGVVTIPLEVGRDDE